MPFVVRDTCLSSEDWSLSSVVKVRAFNPFSLESTFLVTFLSVRGKVIYKEAYDTTWVPEELIVTLGNVGSYCVKFRASSCGSGGELAVIQKRILYV